MLQGPSSLAPTVVLMIASAQFSLGQRCKNMQCDNVLIRADLDSRKMSDPVRLTGPPETKPEPVSPTYKPECSPFVDVNGLDGYRDLGFLEAQGCFRLPTESVLDEFIRLYFLHVHPMLPLLHEGEFWDAYESGNERSPLLLQAMMFASCTVSLPPLNVTS